ncbi:protein RKD3-like [Lycium ferocissimum]|uniref:protein RKD3-like n=1 Tax=Lycium ferocissimum TaxID=112874 RepID=UPI0028155375|nr:protein RKD3-like [Lycium ferocissimum]
MADNFMKGAVYFPKAKADGIFKISRPLVNIRAYRTNAAYTSLVSFLMNPIQEKMQGNSGHYAIDHQYDFAFDAANNPLMMDWMWSEMSGGFGLSTQLFGRTENQELLLCDNNQERIMTNDRVEEKGKQKMLSREAISKYFYMPIIQATKELNIGVTFLKIRCRDLGIRRWPHRKLMSLQTLIKNVKELKRGEGNGMEQKWKDVIDSLEEEKKRMEEIPYTWNLRRKQRD